MGNRPECLRQEALVFEKRCNRAGLTIALAASDSIICLKSRIALIELAFDGNIGLNNHIRSKYVYFCGYLSNFLFF